MSTRSSFLAVLFAWLVLLPAPALAQFDTPNRSFHNGTQFRLEGRHQVVACASCHLNGQFQGTPTTCYDCHWVRRKDDRYQTRLGTVCESCHTPTTWTAVRWDHAGQAGVPLNASHRQVACESCHRDASFRAASVTCISCHQKDFASTTAPNHAAAGFPPTCGSCHRPGEPSWQNGGGGGFSHAAVFPLVGDHATASCQSCHRNNVYRGTPRECIGCHQADYTRTQNPNHAAAGFPTTCETCHRPTEPTWTGPAGGGFNHNTVFALVGVHATQTCTACHRGNVFRGTSRECVGCHQANYNRTQNPNHVAAGFPTTCESCHRPTEPTWTGASFNHNATFALVGRHATAACAACHANGQYRGISRECVGCHQGNYNRTQNPNHVAAGFPTTCESCHRPTEPTWTGTFNHNATFALVGRHAAAACAACHVNGQYRGTARECVGCHQGNYNRTQNPNHVAAGFPTTCESCHRPTEPTWTGASFNHNATFALVGRHATAACAACHVNGQYRGISRECVGCHLPAYNQTRSPAHAAAGFPTTCQSCHQATDSAWTQGRFTHTRFPLTGPHNVTCAQCHTTPNNFTQFSCTTCHERGKTDSDHRGENGYRYDSAACYSCHPNGRH